MAGVLGNPPAYGVLGYPQQAGLLGNPTPLPSSVLAPYGQSALQYDMPPPNPTYAVPGQPSSWMDVAGGAIGNMPLAMAKVLAGPEKAFNRGMTQEEMLRWGPEMALLMAMGGGGRAAAKPRANELGMAGSKGMKRPAALADQPQGIRAYHGSPHDFNQFSMENIGTGEGAQAYGHGLYFAENPSVAGSYKFSGSRFSDQVPVTVGGRSIAGLAGKEGSPTWWAAKSLGHDALTHDGQPNIARVITEWERRPSGESGPAVLKVLREWQNKPITAAGRTYEVSINAHPDEFLDWDKPLSEQPEKVREALAPLLDTSGNAAKTREAIFADFDAGRITREERNAKLEKLLPGAGDQSSGAAIYSQIAGTGEPKLAPLKAAGIKGIRYKDAGSRGAEGGTHNYVVFDDKIISILKKYGVAGLIAAGMGPELAKQLAKSQGVEGEVY